LLFLAPLAIPVAAQIESAEYPRAADYPLHLAIIDLLRRQEHLDIAPFVAVAAEVATNPRRFALSGRRLGHVLGEIARFPSLRAELGPVVARLVLMAPDTDREFASAAHLIAGEAAAARAEWGVAADHERQAARGLLRWPLPPLAERALIGETSVPEGLLAKAHLAALPYLSRARMHVSRSEFIRAAESLAAARGLAEGDVRTLEATAQLSGRMQK